MSDFLESFISKPIPAVDPQDIRRIWPIIWPLKGGDAIDYPVLVRYCSPGADVNSVLARAMVVKSVMLQSAEENLDKALMIAASIPLKPEAGKFGFDMDEFRRQLKGE